MLIFEPHEYQKRAIELLLSKPHCGLFLDPGLGKTVTTLSALKILKQRNLLRRVLIVAPLRVAKYTWPDEIQKWAHLNDLSYTVVHGAEKDELRHAETDIHLINPEGLLWLLPLLAKDKRFSYDWLIIDESSKFKSYSSKRFKLLKPLLGKFARRTILTGTPATNGMMDLFSQMYVVDQGMALGAYITKFRGEFFHQKPFDPYGWYLNDKAEEEIYKRIQHKTMRMDASDYLNIPEKIVQDIYVELPEAALRKYKQMEATLQMQVKQGIVTAANAAVASGKCRQIASGFIYDDQHNATWIHEAKFEALSDLLDELQGKPVLVFYNFVETAEQLHYKFGAQLIKGAATETQRKVLSAWNRGEVPLLAAHPASAGHGLNLQDGGCHIVWVDPTYDLEHYIQANARLYRQGQKNTVVIHRLVARSTLEQAIIKRLEGKDRMQSDLLSALRDYWATT